MQKLIVLAVLGLAACGGKKDDGGGGGAAEVKWPDKPADGTPVVFEFVEVAGKGDKLKAKMRMFNFSDKTVTRIVSTLDYLDGTGKSLKDFPWSMQGPALLDPKGTKDKDMGAFLPAETKKVNAKITGVDFGDGTKWP
jgi:hypothetical protein